ncbi:hypothetical protein QU481_13695 [Crenobacter sp. SG2303]|uniref:ABC transmembrane type-1 domain-containing protein n=1 Tax=Crenobacter oryzisoli TaxID=3056844 RepID=A0ABT7XQ99_9NEIS|nr:hypothetical protein [Crenobacter sp. SG2303]MDN0075940.1 hypothetical protein [Crenobacter sp. SG2303]
MYNIEDGKLLRDLTLDNFHRLVEEPIYFELFVKSVGYAGLTTLLCVLMAYPLAWLIATTHKKWRDLLLLMVILPFWSNFLIRIYAWMIILGPQSAFTLSIDDFVITFFTAGAGAGASTLPLEIYSMIKISVTPEVNAVSSLLMLLTLVLIVIASKVSPSALRGGN